MSEGVRLLLVGYGSIGKRHAVNLTGLSGIKELAICEQDKKNLSAISKEVCAETFSSYKNALAWKPDAVLIATPHTTHVPLALDAIENGAHVLVEKPISDNSKEAIKLVHHAKKLDRLLFTVSNMRYHAGVSTIKQNLNEIGKIYFSRAYFGNYLPNMRPNSDYRTLYCANKKDGGGVAMDSIHEIDYLTWLLGPVKNVIANMGHVSTLDVDVEDYASITMEHTSGARSEVHLDYLQQYKRRGCEVIGSNGTLIWESLGKQPEICTVKLYRSSIKEWEILFHDDALDSNYAYIQMLNEFIDAVDGKDTNLHTGKEAVNALKIVEDAKSFAMHHF